MVWQTNQPAKMEIQLTILKQREIREKQLLAKVNILENKLSKDDVGTKDDYYVVGSSILREVRPDEISNEKVSCINGGLISDVNKNIQNLETTPKAKNTVVGGKDLEKEEATSETVSDDYAMVPAQAKEKFPDTNVIVILNKILEPFYRTEDTTDTITLEVSTGTAPAAIIVV